MNIESKMIIIGILIVLSAFFSLSETAIFSTSRLKVLHLVEKKRKGAKTLKTLQDEPHKTITVILIGNNVVNVTASVLATTIAYDLFKNHALGYATGIMTFLLLVFGEIIPKSIAATYRESIALVIARPIYLFTIFLWPIVWVFERTAAFITKDAPEKSIITEEEIKTIIKAGVRIGEIDKYEAQLIKKVFRFDDVSVGEIMTPRTDMTIISADATLKELAQLIEKNHYSRIPVYESARENIVGIAFTRNLINEKNLWKKVRQIMEKPNFVPETQKIDTLLKQLQKKKQHMAIVVDEHGGVAGLVTMENVLEEIVGDILDEKDKSMPCVKKSGKSSWLVAAKADVSEVNRKLKAKFREDSDFQTIGGMVLSKLERIPKVGDELTVDKFKITVEKLDGNRIKEIRIRK